LIDLRSIFIAYLQQNNKDNEDKNILTYDGVHLNALGNTFVAQQMLNTLSLSYLK